jgi:hypothetical protein
VFGATKKTSKDMYSADRYVSPTACFQKHRFCTPNSKQCTAWGGRYELFNIMIEAIDIFTPRQLATASRISLASLATSIYEAINARSSKCLRAQDKMNWLFQMPLPDNQWEHEVLAWAQEGLAFLQATV